ncbi:hypothetical protein ACFL5A_04535 [Gemmatimonadota bacterium]
MSEQPLPDDARLRAAELSRELSEFLLEFSIGVHRYAMYPPDHPSLAPAAENIIGRLGEIFMERRSLSIGVAQAQLVIEGVATDSKHPVLSDLARRLHEHQLGAISFTKGVVVIQVEELLETLAQDPEREGTPLGLLPAHEIPSWEHVALYPLGYDRLEMKDDGPAVEIEPEKATQLWLGLARSAMASDGPPDPDATPDAQTVARSIQSHRRESAYDQVIVGYLLQLADELKSGKGGEAESVRRRVSTLIGELDDPTLGRLVEMGGSSAQRRQFVLDANQSLAVDSVVKILHAAAASTQQTISSSLTRLLSKLSMHAESGAERVRGQADTALRDNVEELIKDWELADPNPDDYSLVLDAMAKAAPVFQATTSEEDEGLSGAHRLVQMSLEVDSWGPTVAKGVSDLIEAGEVQYLLGLADQAPAESTVARKMREYLTSPSQLKRLLSAVDVDERTLRSIVGRMGAGAIPTLLDALTDSDSRSIRRKVFDVLSAMGDAVGKAIMDRLDEPRWFVVRNMLALVQRLPERPEGFNASVFLDHQDPRVRREAFPLALQDPGARERTLASGLADTDERLLRMALLEVQEGVPETLVPVIVSRVVKSDRSPDLKAMALRSLRKSKSNLALEALLIVASAGKSVFGRPRLAPSAPDVLAALQVLRMSWAQHPKASAVLNLARKAKDPEMRKAASHEGGER